MRKSRSLRNQLTSMLVILVALQSIALVFALIAAQVFARLDAESFRLFNNTAEARADEFNNTLGTLIGNTTVETEYLRDELASLAKTYGTNTVELYQNDPAFEAAMELAADSVLSFLTGNNVTGAFVFFNGSSFDKENPNSHSAIYIRNSAPNVSAGGYTNYMYELGPASISQEYAIPMSSRWAVGAQLLGGENTNTFYHMPVNASQQYPNSEIQRYGYWSPPHDLMGDGQTVITYSMPLLNAEGEAFGVFGFEISLQFLTQNFMPASELPYQNSFYIVANLDEDYVSLDWYIPGSSLAQVYLSEERSLYLAPHAGDNLREVHVEGMGEMYASVHELTLYSANSPFENVNWGLLAFVSYDVLHETSSSVRTLLMGSIALTTAIAIVAAILLPLFATRKIRGLSKHLKGLSGSEAVKIPRTGLGEVDELISAVEKLNRNVLRASQRISKIMELTSLPLGGFEIQEGESSVFLTEYIYSLLGLSSGTPVSQAEWVQHYARLTSEAEPNNPNVYAYNGPLGQLWLRIVISENGGSTVGIIVDVSKEVEENRRLSHELDYDSLTGLYSRYAFKRVAYNRILQAPRETGAMIFADLDNLKYINDNYGHDVGDAYLQMAGKMFSKFQQRGAVAARIAGDEFAIYLHGDGSTQADIRDMLYDMMRETGEYTLSTKDGKTHRVRFSAGVAWYPRDSDNISELLKLADYAMYEAKHQRKGTVVEFNAGSYKENAYLLENREAISRLLDEERITFHFQPIVALRTGEVFAYEALMRSLMKEFKSPMEILSVAAAQGKLHQVEKMVVYKAFEYMHNNHTALGGAKLFVNSLPSQHLNQRDMEKLRHRYPEAMGRIVMEITEDANSTIELMQTKVIRIRAQNNGIAVDDFGAGYSNELRILTLDPDFVKIDMGIVQGIAADTDKQHLAASIIGFCTQKGIQTIAEGVETPQDLEQVIRLGVDYVQGYYTARPSPQPEPITEEMAQTIRALYANNKPQ